MDRVCARGGSVLPCVVDCAGDGFAHMTDPEMLTIHSLSDDELSRYIAGLIREMEGLHITETKDDKIVDQYRRARRRFVVATSEAENRGVFWSNPHGYTKG